ncbi:hypothetical protein CA983_03150 [Streptomyces swartbergensis]|uniref:Uncharacterized protein n=1 Tax=Streptomyces swartbergensis TaxID=487165 RepID=A0A243SC67_9ACTN|nr:hypothetical protein CA983_03150 [Streptomyces swartbergensis]
MAGFLQPQPGIEQPAQQLGGAARFRRDRLPDRLEFRIVALPVQGGKLTLHGAIGGQAGQ